jgi:hypothetical protein
MERAFAQRRRQIVSDSHQLRLDVDHFNSVHPEEAQLPLVLDFTDALRKCWVLRGSKETRLSRSSSTLRLRQRGQFLTFVAALGQQNALYRP